METSPNYYFSRAHEIDRVHWFKVGRKPEAKPKRAKQSRELGARLVRVQGERIFLDELDPSSRGLPMKSMAVECGIFCEEPA